MMFCKRKHSLSGFTLIEILLASVLAATLLAALWSLLSMYARIFDTGQAQTQQSQLARELLHQLSDDLHGIVQPSPREPALPAFLVATPTEVNSASASTNSANLTQPGTGNAPGLSPPPAPQFSAAVPGVPTSPSGNRGSNPPANDRVTPFLTNRQLVNPEPPTPSLLDQNSLLSPTTPDPMAVITTSLRPSGLIGTDNFLQMDIVQPTFIPLEKNQDPSTLGATPPPRALELRTVVYSFGEGNDVRYSLHEPVEGLTRREFCWESVHPALRDMTTQRANPTDNNADNVGLSGANHEDVSLDTSVEDVPVESSQNIPEVTHFEIHYFNGMDWTSEWNSVASQSLPVAVEIIMQLRSYEETEPQVHHPTNEAAGEDDPSGQPKLPVYRLVIYLPTAKRPASGIDRGGMDPRDVESSLRADSHGESR